MTKVGWLHKWFGIASKKGKGATVAEPEEETPPAEGKKDHFRVLRVQPTPNPDAFQFLIEEKVIGSGTRTFASAEEAKGDEFAEALFSLFGVENIFIQENFVTITKSGVVGWHTILEPIHAVIQEHLTFYESGDQPQEERPASASVLEQFSPEDFVNGSNEQKTLIIEAILDQAIRPALANDGGGLDVLHVEGNVVKVHYQGACGSCPSSTTGTLQYIQSFLRETLHEEILVEAN